ncbi:hypothetical protein B4064_1203 [Caldibacillus thermoamylovorans]|uniref:MauE/DoxX family redox-associated membrane protein n=1 Tax=Caldibacillus thermoamylovorans TaxID=35841 RepID=UPI0005A46AD6|nr:MauE/DoxX family redox-associated membrane protein [Caldibacillus thermoamylovorans]KIO65734.1 hypothetical protein B4065_2499 [Caldibacillus thermoamylovorans]KIO69589.1 hypothetical protein B4064_1203 [Caldibacillus thermoamylovorans]
MVIINLLYFFEVVMGGILLSSAFSHSKNTHKFKNSIKSYNIVKKNSTIRFLSIIIILMEFLFGLFMVLNIFKLATLFGTLCLLSIFTIAILYNLINGNKNISCGCGGIVGDSSLSWKLVARNIFIILILIIDIIYSYIYIDVKPLFNHTVRSVIYGFALLTLLVINTNNYLNKIKNSIS